MKTALKKIKNKNFLLNDSVVKKTVIFSLKISVLLDVN